MQRAFIIRPFGKKKDGAGSEIDFERVSTCLIEPALKAVGLGGGTTGEIVEAGNIRADMFALIIEADIVVCDMTIHNANVFYELGIRHALRKKRSVLIRGTPVADAVPFDNLTDRYLAYDINNPETARKSLIDTLKATLASERTDSPIFSILPALEEVDPSSIQILRRIWRKRLNGPKQPRRSAGCGCCPRRLRHAVFNGRPCGSSVRRNGTSTTPKARAPPIRSSLATTSTTSTQTMRFRTYTSGSTKKKNGPSCSPLLIKQSSESSLTLARINSKIPRR
jgi:hypothetical protein